MYKGLNRGCGRRKAGLPYAVTGSPQERGMVELDLAFRLVCPPWVPWTENPSEIGLAAQGIRILERRDPAGKGLGVWDIWDWIGENDYPYWMDFYREAQVYGTSRLIPTTAPYKLLTPESRHMFVHAKAGVIDPLPILKYWQRFYPCPKEIEFHLNPDIEHGIYESCLGYLVEAIGPYNKKNEGREITVELPRNRDKDVPPSCTYKALTLPPDVTVEYYAGVFMWDTIERFEVVEDPIDKKHERALKLIQDSGCSIPYILCEE